MVEDGKEGPGAMKIGVGSAAIGPNGEVAYSAKTCCSMIRRAMEDMALYV